MRWPIIVVLVVLGLLAALSTAVLIGVIKANPFASDDSAQVEIIVAKKPLSAMSVIASDDITTKIVRKNELPEGYLTNSVQALGKVLGVPVVEGQPMTKSCFVSEGSFAQLAAAIPPGMRAISLMLSNQAITGGLLYPGGVVDILVSFKLPTQQRAKGQALSTTLLQGIQVLAVNDATVVSNEEQKGSSIGEGSSGKRLMVTFMVDPKQAEALQLAREYGSVSVAMRNPLDQHVFSSEATLLSEGQLAKFSALLTPSALAAEQKKISASRMRNIDGRISDIEGGDNNETEVGLESEDAYYAEEAEQTSTWDITVIRGKDVKVQEMEMPGEKTAAAAVEEEK